MHCDDFVEIRNDGKQRLLSHSPNSELYARNLIKRSVSMKRIVYMYSFLRTLNEIIATGLLRSKEAGDPSVELFFFELLLVRGDGCSCWVHH